MTADERRPAPERLLDERASASREDARIAGLLARVPEPVAPRGMRERVWRKLRDDDAHQTAPAAALRRTRFFFFAPAAIAIAAAIVVIAIVWRERSSPAELMVASGGAELVFTSGAVEVRGPFDSGLAARGLRSGRAEADGLAPGTVLVTGEESQAMLRGVDFAVRLGPATELAIGSDGRIALDLRRGSIVVAVEPHRRGAPFIVKAPAHEVRVTGTVFSVAVGETTRVAVAEGSVVVGGGAIGGERKVATGQCWTSSPASGGGEPAACDPGMDPRLIRELARAPAATGRVRIEGPAQLAVRTADGLELGHPPITWSAPAGKPRLEWRDARGGSATSAADLDVAPGSEVVRVLEAALQQTDTLVQSPSVPHAPPRVAAVAKTRRSLAAAPPAIAAPLQAPATEPATPAIGAVAEAEAEAEAGSEALAARAYRDAQRMVREHRYEEAQVGFARIASAGGAGYAELAQFELGWLRLRHLKDPAGALAALDEYRRRYPAGRLRDEVALTAVEAAVADHARERALREIDQLLPTMAGDARAPQLRLLRAHLLRESGLFEPAALGYAALARGAGPISDDAAYFGAVCLARVGRTDEARAQLENYLERFPAGAHRAETNRLLGFSNAGDSESSQRR